MRVFPSLPAALSVGALLMATPLAAQSAGFTDLASVDRAVQNFTGAAIGSPGGARTQVDRRLRLAPCTGALRISYHDRSQSSVLVQCRDGAAWRLFVPLAKVATPQAAQELIARGDSVSIAVEGRGFSVAQTGEALESGAAGDWIRVKPPGKSEPIRARVDRPGRVVIPLS